MDYQEKTSKTVTIEFNESETEALKNIMSIAYLVFLPDTKEKNLAESLTWSDRLGYLEYTGQVQLLDKNRLRFIHERL